MREIKFRAWDSKDKKMHFYPIWFALHERMVLCFAHNDSYVDESDSDTTVKLMQYTGLKDKNGQEIYEGDIVEFTVNEKQGYKYITKKYKGVVKYWLFNCAYIVEVDKKGSFFSGEVLNNCMVVGNIYVDSELQDNLKQKRGGEQK